MKQKFDTSCELRAESEAQHEAPTHRCPVFVMMPLDTVVVQPDGDGSTSSLQTPDALDMALDKIMQAKVQVRARCMAKRVREVWHSSRQSASAPWQAYNLVSVHADLRAVWHMCTCARHAVSHQQIALRVCAIAAGQTHRQSAGRYGGCMVGHLRAPPARAV